MRAGGGPPARAEILPLLARPSGAGAAEVMPLPRGGSRTCKGDRRSGAGRLGSGHASGYAMVAWYLVGLGGVAVEVAWCGPVGWAAAPRAGRGTGGSLFAFLVHHFGTLYRTVYQRTDTAQSIHTTVSNEVNTIMRPVRSGAQPSPRPRPIHQPTTSLLTASTAAPQLHVHAICADAPRHPTPLHLRPANS